MIHISQTTGYPRHKYNAEKSRTRISVGQVWSDDSIIVEDRAYDQTQPETITDSVPLQLTIHFALEGVISPGWEIVRPITLFLEMDQDDDEDDTFIVSDDVFGRYGAGDTIRAARDDYVDTLIGYYQIIERQAREYPANVPILNRLREYIKHIEG